MFKKRFLLAALALSAASLMVAACGGMEEPEDSAQTVQEALEMEYGGLDMGDELPLFGLADLDLLDIDVSSLQIPEEQGLETYTGAASSLSAADTSPSNNALQAKKPIPPPCPHGFLKGVWKSLKPGYGIFKGKWANAKGTVIGHLKGIYGKNLKGSGVLFGKYIDTSGKFKGLLKGHWGKGFFKGRWLDASGLRGSLHGVYAKGVFVGKWTAFCLQCMVTCKPGFINVPNPCLCVPQKVVPCKVGQCAKGMFCDICPPPPGCQVGVNCPAVCAPPICVAKPTTASSAPKAQGSASDSAK